MWRPCEPSARSHGRRLIRNLRRLHTRMKNANVFVDVDLTLIDANGKLLDGAREALQRLRDEGCHLFLWSTAGADYCRKVAHLYGMTQFVYDVRQERSWDTLAERIIDEHID